MVNVSEEPNFKFYLILVPLNKEPPKASGCVLDSADLELSGPLWSSNQQPVRWCLLCEPESQNIGNMKPPDNLPLRYVYTYSVRKK